MSDGHDTDATAGGDDPQLPGRISEIADHLERITRSIDVLDRELQRSQLAMAQSDQRWEERLDSLEQRLSDLDTSLRGEVERVRGSATVMEMLIEELRASASARTPAASSDVDEVLSRLVDRVGELVEQQPDLDRVLDQIGSLRVEAPDLGEVRDLVAEALNRPVDLGPVLAALDDLRRDDPDLSSVIDELRRLQGTQTELSQAVGAIEELRTELPDVVQVRVDALMTTAAERQQAAADLTRRELRAIADRLDPLGSAVGELATRITGVERTTATQAGDLAEASLAINSVAEHLTAAEGETGGIDLHRVELDAITDELRALRARVAEPAAVLERIDAIAQRLDVATDALAADRTELTRLSASVGELGALLADDHLLEGIGDRVDKGLRRPLLSALEELGRVMDAQSDRHPDSEAVLDRLASLSDRLERGQSDLSTQHELLTHLGEDLGSLTALVRNDRLADTLGSRLSGELLGPLHDSLEQLGARIDARPDDPPITPDDLTAQNARIEQLLAETATSLEAALARQQSDHRATIEALIERIPDPSDEMTELRATLGDVARQTALDELVMGVTAAAERTETALATARDSIVERLGTGDQAHRDEIATLRATVESFAQHQGTFDVTLRELVDAVTAGRAATEAHWARAMAFAEQESAAPAVDPDEIGRLADAVDTLRASATDDRDVLESLASALQALAAQSDDVRISLQALDAAAPNFESALGPLHATVGALRHLIDQNAGRLDALARTLENWTSGPALADVHDNLEQRIEGLLERQASLQADVRELRPVLDQLVAHDPTDAISGALASTGLDADLLHGLRDRVEGTEVLLRGQADVLGRLEDRADTVASAVGVLDDLAGRIAQLDDLGGRIDAVAASVDRLEPALFGERIGGLDQQLRDARQDVAEAVTAIVERVEAAGGRADAIRAESDQATDAHRLATQSALGSLTTTTAEVVEILRDLRADLVEQRDLTAAGFEGVLGETRDAVERVGGATTDPTPALEAVIARLDRVDHRLVTVASEPAQAVAEVGIELGGRVDAIDDRLARIAGRLEELDTDVVRETLTRALDEQRARDEIQAAALRSSNEATDLVRETLADLTTRVASLDLDGVTDTIRAVEHEQRAGETRLAETIGAVRSLVAELDQGPLLARLDAIESEIGVSQSGIRSALADLRAAAPSIDVAGIEARLDALAHRQVEASAAVDGSLSTVLEAVERVDLSPLDAAISAADDRSSDRFDEIGRLVDDVVGSLDLEAIRTELAELRARTEQLPGIVEVGEVVRELGRELGAVDLSGVTRPLAELNEAVHAAGDATRAALGDHLDAISRQLGELDLAAWRDRLDELVAGTDRLAETVNTELAATPDRVGAVVAREASIAVAEARSSTEQGTRALQGEVTALREAVAEQLAEHDDDRREVVGRIDLLGNTLVERLEEAERRADVLSGQVSSMQAAIGGGDHDAGALRAHLDRALEDLAERMGSALRELRVEVVAADDRTDRASIRTMFESGLDRATQRIGADVARVLEAIEGADDTDRIRRIDGSLTQIRRDFELLRRLSERALAGDSPR